MGQVQWFRAHYVAPSKCGQAGWCAAATLKVVGIFDYNPKEII
jgi:hypothetical protein